MKTLGDRIRELRDERDFSIRELCRKAGDISPAYLSDIELGRRHPSDAVLRAIADALGTSFGELKQHDMRPAVEEMKRRAIRDPKLGFAFRTMLDANVSADELLEFAEKRAKQEKE